MKIKTYRFCKGISIINLGDIHRGDKNCDVDAYLKAVEEVRTHDDLYWLSTGDILNVALKTGASDCYESLSLDEEFAKVEKEIAPIAHKCLGIVSSNHHRRLKNLTGFDLDKQISKVMNIPYLGKLGCINVVCGRSSYFIVLHHGVGFGRKRGSKANNTEMLAELIPGADIYLEGHTHTQDAFINDTAYIDRKRLLLTSFHSHFVTTGHYLQYENSYAQDYKLPSRPIGSSIISLKYSIAGTYSVKKVKTDFFC